MNEIIMDIIHVAVPVLIVAAALLTAIFRDLLAAALSFAAMSLFLSLEFFLLNAPDVAIAEAAIGACISTAILIIGIRMTKRHEEERDEPKRKPDAVEVEA